MNVHIILLVTLSAAWALNIPLSIREKWVEVASPYYSECICESGADSTKAINVLKNSEYPNDACVKCFLKCVEIRVGLMVTDGTVIPGAWVDRAEGITLETANRCVNETNNILDTCEKAYELSKCVVKSVSLD
ncbi:hypothetical protein FQR65_LT05715 [Abscondita terminalis]|nr:hypothetical protein FQR65_LT05715 [Abscondita terminalis]